MEENSKQLNDRGMTLVELLVAMVILAIIVVPLLHTFISAARVNMNSKKRLRFTTIAQDVMEGLRADTLKEVAMQIYDPATTMHIINPNLIKGSIGEIRCEIDADGEVKSMTAVSSAAPNADDRPSVETVMPVGGGISYNFVPKPSGKYYYTMQDVTVENIPGISNTKVDVIIKADAAPYSTNDVSDPAYRAGGGTVSGDMARHNAYSMVDISAMDGEKDFLFSIDDVKMLEDLNVHRAPGTPEYKLTDVYMNVELSVSKVPGTGKTQALIEYEFIDKNNVAIKSATESKMITKDEIRNVFLLYRPTYNGKMSDTPSPDVITFTNNDYDEINFFIVKQDNADFSGWIEDYEKNYKCNVNILEPTATGDPHVNIRTNLDYNLQSIVDSGFSESSKTPSPQAVYSYISPHSTTLDARYISSLGGSRVDDRIYDVYVYVYEEGSLASAPVNGNKIPKEKLLVSIKGSME